jgi:uncharacterized membrane protein YdbT with pleckstrin-like domain
MASEGIVLKPKVLSGSISRVLESFKHDNDDVRISEPGMEDNQGNRMLPHFFLSAAISVFLVGTPALLAYNSLIDIGIDVSASPYMLVPFAMIIPLVMFPIQVFFVSRELKHRKYIIKPNSVDIEDNYLDRSIKSASFDNMTDAKMEKPLVQRLFGTGNVLLNTDGSDTKEIKIEFIDNPETLQEELSDIISETDYKQPI